MTMVGGEDGQPVLYLDAERLDPYERLDHQSAWLGELVAHAYEHAPTTRRRLDDAGLQPADLRGLGETVVTVVHSHGWSTECGKCNENANCPLAECTLVSLSDYQVLETLFPGKGTVMPIVGRRLGAPGKQPVLALHAWRGGEMRPLRFQRYAD